VRLATDGANFTAPVLDAKRAAGFCLCTGFGAASSGVSVLVGRRPGVDDDVRARLDMSRYPGNSSECRRKALREPASFAGAN
jgi:hypothetical protein